MTESIANRIFEEVAATIDIPDLAYEKAEQRYEDVGEWFGRSEAKCSPFNPHIYPQGSFRLGTVVRPVNSEHPYDLDLGCRLRVGITKVTHTQKQLKHLVGVDLEDYRIARGIKEKKEEMHRCWRLNYADTLKFHMDTVPSIPESLFRRQLIEEAMTKAGVPGSLARNVADLTGAITDNRLSNYDLISNDWRISNSEGYARWFESRMKLARMLLEKRAVEAKKAQVDDLPAYRWKTPLQRSVQILKRHRDVMFADNPDAKPTSIIITTLAGEAYQGEAEIADALGRILSTMGSLINTTSPRVPNPVNPTEDFADKWSDPKKQHLFLEQNFWLWIERAKADFQIMGNARDVDMIVEQAKKKYASALNADGFGTKLGLRAAGNLLKQAVVPPGLSFPPKPLIPSKPGGFA